MTTPRPVTDQDGNKPYRADDESLANRNVTRPAPLNADRAADDEAEDDSGDGDTRADDNSSSAKPQ